MRIAANKPGWQRIFGLALLVHVAGSVTRWSFPGLVSKNQVWALAATVLVLKMLIDLPEAIQGYSRARRSGASALDSLRTMVPVELIGMFRLERATLRAFGDWLLRRPPAVPMMAGQRFSYYQGSQYATIFIIVMVACVTELPLSYLMMDVLINDAVVARYTHWAVLATAIYTIALIFGDRHLVRHTAHVLTPDRVQLSVGARFHADIALTALEHIFPIDSAKELSEAKKSWLRRNGFDPAETVIGTPIDVPNVAIVLNTSVPVTIEKFRTARHQVRNVLVYVDNPASFVQAVRKRLHAEQPAEEALKP